MSAESIVSMELRNKYKNIYDLSYEINMLAACRNSAVVFLGIFLLFYKFDVKLNLTSN